MSSEPLVSIAMPCYNAARTLPMALASLLAQTYENWECLLVDDGSTDQPRNVVDRVGDPRIRYIPLDRNYGRGVARQVALDHAKGELLGMLDADDWIYPSKLSAQVEFLHSEPTIALVSTGMAIVGIQGELAGVRSCDSNTEGPVIKGPMVRIAPPPVAHAPSLIRMPLARLANYDPTLRLGQDVDFLLRVLLDRRLAILPFHRYSYTEHESVNLTKIMGGLQSLRCALRKHRSRFPVSSRLEVTKTFGKAAVYRVAYALGLGDSLIRRRSQPPTAREVEEFQAARREVISVVERIFQGSSETRLSSGSHILSNG